MPIDFWEDKAAFISLWIEEGLLEKFRILELDVHLSKRYLMRRMMIGAVWMLERDLTRV